MKTRRLTSLPKWAQDLVLSKDRELEAKERELTALRLAHSILVSREWFIFGGPKLYGRTQETERSLFFCDREGTHKACTLFDDDVLLIGRHAARLVPAPTGLPVPAEQAAPTTTTPAVMFRQSADHCVGRQRDAYLSAARAAERVQRAGGTPYVQLRWGQRMYHARFYGRPSHPREDVTAREHNNGQASPPANGEACV